MMFRSMNTNALIFSYLPFELPKMRMSTLLLSTISRVFLDKPWLINAAR